MTKILIIATCFAILSTNILIFSSDKLFDDPSFNADLNKFNTDFLEYSEFSDLTLCDITKSCNSGSCSSTSNSFNSIKNNFTTSHNNFCNDFDCASSNFKCDNCNSKCRFCDDICPNDPTRMSHRNDKCDLVCSTCCYPCGSTTFIPRSQGANVVRELIGWQNQIYQPFLCQNYASAAIAFEYTRSFRSSRIAQRLFCTDCLTFSGSQVTSRVNGQDIIADHFGLPTDFKGTLSIKPRIENYILDFNFFFGLDDWFCGSFLRIHFPLVHTRWTLGLDECVICDEKSKGSPLFPACYMSTNQAETTSNIALALSGDFLFGDMKEKWKFGRFSFCPLSKTRIADIDVILGYNILQSDCYHLALYGQVVVPTGNRPSAVFIFEPIVGNGKMWEAGVGFSTHILFGHNRGTIGLFAEGNVTHKFKTSQIRSFDFTKNGLLSRYMLLKEFDQNNTYDGKLINAINFATRQAEVKIDFKVDVAAKLYIEYCSWIFDVGYNIYAQDEEKVCLKTDCPCEIDQRRFGIKGTEGVCCNEHKVNLAMNTIDINFMQRTLNSTEPNATMFNVIIPNPVTIDSSNAGQCVESPTDKCVCLSFLNPPVVNTSLTNQTFVLANNQATPEIITCKNLDINSAVQCRIVTHKVFTHLGYTWFDYCYEPHFGIGAEIEIDGSKFKAGLSQWGIWFKAGITF